MDNIYFKPSQLESHKGLLPSPGSKIVFNDMRWTGLLVFYCESTAARDASSFVLTIDHISVLLELNITIKIRPNGSKDRIECDLDIPRPLDERQSAYFHSRTTFNGFSKGLRRAYKEALQHSCKHPTSDPKTNTPTSNTTIFMNGLHKKIRVEHGMGSSSISRT
uniref:Uncharacterized protein n=1 Tax=Cannabis sativa TaxID=3483 RepID=A0A803NW17_CANSA